MHSIQFMHAYDSDQGCVHYSDYVRKRFVTETFISLEYEHILRILCYGLIDLA